LALIIAIGGLAAVCVIGVIVIFAGLTMLGQQVSSTFSEINSSISAASELTVSTPVAASTSGAVPIGTAAEAGGLSITVTEAAPFTSTAEGISPEDGNEFWSVNITFENTSGDLRTITAISSYMQDSSQNVYQYSLFGGAGAPGTPLDVVESIGNGRTSSGTLVYEVPTDASELFWVYQDSLSGEVAVIKVK
jgi:hypothetical protein